MKKKFRIIVVIVIISLGIYKIVENIYSNDNVYVVSEKESENNKEKDENTNIEKENIVKEKMITIFISGEIKNPNVVTIESDKRLADAVEKLGGITENADLNNINLAIKIEDGKHYIIPKIGDKPQVSTIVEKNLNVESKKMNINTASKEELDTLPGVGEVTANKIIQYREEKGEFRSIEELKNVNGIGEKKYNDIKDLISVQM